MQSLFYSIPFLVGISTSALPADLVIFNAPMPGIVELSATGEILPGPGMDFLNQLKKQTKFSIDLITYPQPRARMMVDKTSNSCIALSESENMKNQYKWTQPFLKVRTVLLAKFDDGRQWLNLDQVKKFRVGSVRGSAVSDALKKMNIPIVETANFEVGLRMLQLDRLDLMGMQDIFELPLVNKLGTAKPRTVFVLGIKEIAYACNPALGDDVLNKLNAAISSLIKNGTIKQIFPSADGL